MSSPADPAREEPDPRRWRALTVCLIAGFMTLLDVSIVNVALPSMQTGLGASASELSWVVSGYALTFGLVLVPAGRLGDDRGRRRMFVLGLALFTATSVAAGLATTPIWLVVTRLLQGVAGGLLTPQVVGFIQSLFRGRERGRAFGLYGAVIGVSTAVGPLLGGLLLQWAGETDGWRWVFYVNVPIGVVALALCPALLPADDTSGSRRPLDLVGALLLGLGVVAVMYPLVLAEQDLDTAPWWLLGVAAALLLAFVGWERRYRRRRGHPLVDFALLRTRSYAVGTVVGLIYFAGFTAIFFVLTLFFQQGLHYTPLDAGLALTPFAVGGAVSSAAGGRLVSRAGRLIVVIGLVLVAVGLAGVYLVLRLGPDALFGWPVGWAIAIPMLVAGVGGGFVIAPNQTIALEQVPPREGGTAAGVLQTGQRIGSALGIAAVGAVFFGQLTQSRGDWFGAISLGLLGAVGFVVLALLVGLVDLLIRRAPAEAEEPPAPETAAPQTAAPASTAPTPTAPARAVAPRPAPARPAAAPTVNGRVRTTDGAGAGDAVLTMVDRAGHQAARGHAGTDGTFAMDAPAPGIYQLIAADGAAQARAVWVEVTTTGAADLDVTLALEPGLRA